MNNNGNDGSVDISLDDIDDAIAIPRAVSKDVQSRKSYRERRGTYRDDFETVTKVETLPSMRELINAA